MQAKLNNKGVSLTPEEAASINTRFEQYNMFTVKGRGKDESDILLKFKVPSHAVNAFNLHIEIGCLVGKHANGSNDKIAERI